MKVVSTDGNGNTLVEFENLRQHTNVIGVDAPVRALIPKGKLKDFQADAAVIRQQGRAAGQRFMAIMTGEPEGPSSLQ